MSTQEYDPKKVSEQDKISLTDAAVAHIKKEFSKHAGTMGIRLSTKKTGCSGNAYVIDLIEQTEKDDHVFDDHGITIAVSFSDFPMLKGTRLDYIREGLNARFAYSNPNETGSCGCGESFTVK